MIGQFLMESLDLNEFDRESGRWSRVLDGYVLTGNCNSGPVQFLITADALGDMLTPGSEAVDAELGVAIFNKFERDIFRIAKREARSRGTKQKPIILKREDMC